MDSFSRSNVEGFFTLLSIFLIFVSQSYMAYMWQIAGYFLVMCISGYAAYRQYKAETYIYVLFFAICGVFSTLFLLEAIAEGGIFS